MHEELKRRLDRFEDMLDALGKSSHHTPQEYPKAVKLFVDIYRDGYFVHCDDVKHWALDKGWREDDAHDLHEMAETIYETLLTIGTIPPAHLFRC